MSESEIIQRARVGDHEAFGQLVADYQTSVYSLAYRMLGEAGAAEDAAQETFIRAYTHLHRYDPERPFRTWLLSIAAHYCVDHLRKRRFAWLSLDDELATPEPLDMGPRAVDPYRVVAERELNQAIQALLQQLNPIERAAITLHYWFDYSYEDIAQALHLTVSAVKARLFRARRLLAAAMQAENRPQALRDRRQVAEPPAAVARDRRTGELTRGLVAGS